MQWYKFLLIILTVFFSLFGATTQKTYGTSSPFKNGDRVILAYKGKLDDGTVFDASSNHGSPMKFKVGSGQVIPGFDEVVIVMKESWRRKNIHYSISRGLWGQHSQTGPKKFHETRSPKTESLRLS